MIWLLPLGCALGAVIAWLLLRRNVQTTGKPTDPAAAIKIAQTIDDAGLQASKEARSEAEAIYKESDAQLADRIAALQARGKQGK